MSRATVTFRVDASRDIGSGHVMRCLALADGLRERGAQCVFVCRPLPGDLLGRIAEAGFEVVRLPADDAAPSVPGEGGPAHAHWLATTWDADARETAQALSGGVADWLVVDHYALDYRWERALRFVARRVMVIDDLADRAHDCDLLLDAGCGRQASDYDGLVGAGCKRLIGPRHALLRPEFRAWREASLRARRGRPATQLLISMGGVDRDDYTGRVLHALRDCALPADMRIGVVMGPDAPWLDSVRKMAASMPWPVEVAEDVRDMAARMVDCDLAIGAGGTSAIERCCVGVPSLIMIMAANQLPGARALAECGAAIVFERADGLAELLDGALRREALVGLSEAAARVTDGHGVERACEGMLHE